VNAKFTDFFRDTCFFLALLGHMLDNSIASAFGLILYNMFSAHRSLCNNM
jgi:hypothetical protein